MSMQSNLILSNSISRFSGSYSKIETKEDECYIDPKDIQLGIYSKEEDKTNNTIFPVNSDQLIPISIDNKQNYFYKKLGNTYSFFGDIYGNPRIIIGPHWYLYASVSGFFTFGFMLINIYLGKYLSSFTIFLGFLSYFIFIFSYSYTALINPGYPKHDIDSVTGEPRKKFYYCSTCKMWVNREKRTLHCSDCNICIEGLDHHCPWTGKCIGKKNLISFYIFIISIFFLIGHFMLAVSSINRNYLKKDKKVAIINM